MVKHDKQVRMQQKEDRRLRASRDYDGNDPNYSEADDSEDDNNDAHDSDEGKKNKIRYYKVTLFHCSIIS